MKNSNFYTISLAFVVSIGGLLLGISANVSGASEFYRTYFNLEAGSILEGLGVSIAMLATFIGTFNAGILSDRIGRKRSLLIAAILFTFCTLGSALATNFTFFLITRFIGGLGIGIGLVVVPMFIAEFSPSSKRGFLVSFYQLNIGIGFLLAYLINSIVISQVSDNEMVWRWMLGVGVVFPIIYFILLLFIPESPRWLILQGKEQEAKETMRKIGGDEYAEAELLQIKISAKQTDKSEKTSYKNTWSKLFSKKMSLVVLIAFSVAFFQMASGFNSIMFFAPKIFRLAGFSGSGSFLQSNLIGITMVVMTIISMFLIDRLGRKPLLLIGVSLMALSLMVSTFAFSQAKFILLAPKVAVVAGEGTPESSLIAETLYPQIEKIYESETQFFHQFKNDIKLKTERLIEFKQKNTNSTVPFNELITKEMGNKLSSSELSEKVSSIIYSNYKDKLLDETISIQSIWVMISILGFVVGFSISLGPITWALLSEVFPGSVRGLGVSIASTLNGITSFAVVTLLPIELEYLGSATTFFIYGLLMLLFLAMVIKWFPETKGKTLEEIESELVKK